MSRIFVGDVNYLNKKTINDSNIKITIAENVKYEHADFQRLFGKQCDNQQHSRNLEDIVVSNTLMI